MFPPRCANHQIDFLTGSLIFDPPLDDFAPRRQEDSFDSFLELLALPDRIPLKIRHAGIAL